MLNKSKLIKELQAVSGSLFKDFSDEYHVAQKTWQKICDDPTFMHKVCQAEPPWITPTWQGNLGDVFPVAQGLNNYAVFSVDGSQIYPDRHQGTSCFLINVGIVELSYGNASGVKLNSEPYVFLGDEDDAPELSAELINCKRQQLELQTGVEVGMPSSSSFKAAEQRSRKLQTGVELEQKQGSTFLVDGSLIFWHLEAKDTVLRERFLSSYLTSLHQLQKQQVLVAGYISLPKSRELVNLIKLDLCNFDPENNGAHQQVDHCIDTTIAQFFLKPYTRTTVFKNHAKICEHYLDALHPHFFYIHVGTEIGRVEIPAWIAQDESKIDYIAQVVLDQSVKGRGYPVVIAEAHEQAVVKGPDREFFYHLITKFGLEQKQRRVISQKSIKKRGIGI